MSAEPTNKEPDNDSDSDDNLNNKLVLTSNLKKTYKLPLKKLDDKTFNIWNDADSDIVVERDFLRASIIVSIGRINVKKHLLKLFTEMPTLDEIAHILNKNKGKGGLYAVRAPEIQAYVFIGDKVEAIKKESEGGENLDKPIFHYLEFMTAHLYYRDIIINSPKVHSLFFK